MKKALLIIDVQNDYFAGGKSELYNPVDALDNIEAVLKQFREKKLPVIFVQHISLGKNAAFFLPDTEGVQLHERLRPLDNEYVVTKHAPSCFLNTNLTDIVRDNGITEFVICGMMSHMCIDTTTRACMDHGLKATLPEDACTTKDLTFSGRIIPARTVHAAHMASLNGTFANVIKTGEFRI